MFERIQQQDPQEETHDSTTNFDEVSIEPLSEVTLQRQILAMIPFDIASVGV